MVHVGALRLDSVAFGLSTAGKGGASDDDDLIDADTKTCPFVPRSLAHIMSGQAIADDPETVGRIFGLNRPVSVGCVILASRLANKLFPDACKPVRHIWDLVQIGEAMGTAFFLKQGGFAVTNPQAFFHPRILGMAQSGLRQTPFI